MVTLLRISPYPFSIVTILLSTTNISFSTFLTASSIALTKNALHVYFGGQVRDLAEMKKMSPAKIVVLALSILFAIGMFIYFAVYTSGV